MLQRFHRMQRITLGQPVVRLHDIDQLLACLSAESLGVEGLNVTAANNANVVMGQNVGDPHSGQPSHSHWEFSFSFHDRDRAPRQRGAAAWLPAAAAALPQPASLAAPAQSDGEAVVWGTLSL